MAEMMNITLQVYGELENIKRFYNILIAETEWMSDPPKEDDEYVLADGISWADLNIIDVPIGKVGIIEGETKYSVREWDYRMNKVWPSKDGKKVWMTFDVLTKLLDLDVIIDGYCPTYGEVTKAEFRKGEKLYFDIYEDKEEEDTEEEK